MAAVLTCRLRQSAHGFMMFQDLWSCATLLTALGPSRATAEAAGQNDPLLLQIASRAVVASRFTGNRICFRSTSLRRPDLVNDSFVKTCLDASS